MIKIPNIKNEIDNIQIEKCLENNFEKVASSWFPFQLTWLNNSYSKAKDHEKWLIIIFLLSKVVKFYSRNFISYSLEDYNKIDHLEIKDIKVVEISKKLNLSKETVRRKVLELEQKGFLKKNKKNLSILITPKNFPGATTKKAMNILSILCSIISSVLYEKKALNKKITRKDFENHFAENFTYSLQNFYEMQIEIIKNWKNFFGDIDLHHIFAVCVIYRNYDFAKTTFIRERNEYLKKFLFKKNLTVGINAMSISEISGIPRATVVRKLKFLVKEKLLVKDKKKLYTVAGQRYNELEKIQKINLKLLSTFITKTVNQILIKI